MFLIHILNNNESANRINNFRLFLGVEDAGALITPVKPDEVIKF